MVVECVRKSLKIRARFGKTFALEKGVMTNAGHVETFRLFELSRAEGLGQDLRLDQWEQVHLQQCGECRNAIDEFQRQFEGQAQPLNSARQKFAPDRFSVGDQVQIVGPGSHDRKHGVVINVVESKTGDFVYRYSVRLEDGMSDTFFGFELWRERQHESVRVVQMVCEEHKQLLSELNAARGEWIHFRLTADKRAAGITEAKSKEMVSRAKDKMDEINSRMLATRRHVKSARTTTATTYLMNRSGGPPS